MISEEQKRQLLSSFENTIKLDWKWLSLVISVFVVLTAVSATAFVYFELSTDYYDISISILAYGLVAALFWPMARHYIFQYRLAGQCKKIPKNEVPKIDKAKFWDRLSWPLVVSVWLIGAYFCYAFFPYYNQDWFGILLSAFGFFLVIGYTRIAISKLRR